jgi:hypothetical protein
VTALAMVRQIVGIAAADRARVDYRLRGRLSGGLLGTVTFRDEGQVDLPALTQRALGGAASPSPPTAPGARGNLAIAGAGRSRRGRPIP